MTKQSHKYPRLWSDNSSIEDWLAWSYLGFGHEHLAIAWFGTVEVIVGVKMPRNQTHCHSSALTYFIITLFIYVTVLPARGFTAEEAYFLWWEMFAWFPKGLDLNICPEGQIWNQDHKPQDCSPSKTKLSSKQCNIVQHWGQSIINVLLDMWYVYNSGGEAECDVVLQ